MEALILLAIIPALIWLMKESKWLRVNLVYIPDIVTRKAWSELRPVALSIPNSQKPFWLKFPDNMTPLCGLDWIEDTMHVVPEYKFEIKAYNVKHTITLKQADSKILKDIAVATLKPSKTERAELTAIKRASKSRVSRELVRV